MPRENTNYLSYSKKFKQNFNQNTINIIFNCNLLAEAREDLNDNGWKNLQQKINLSERVTQMLTKIGNNKILTNTKYINILPGTYGAIYHLTKFKDARLKSLLDSGKITSSTTRQQVNIFRRGNVPTRDITKKENTKRFLNIRLNYAKSLSTDAMRSFEKELTNLVLKYKSKLKLDIEDFKLTKRLEDRKKELLDLLDRDLKAESNKSNPNYNNVYRNYKDRLNLFDNDTIGSAQLLVDNISKKKKKIFK